MVIVFEQSLPTWPMDLYMYVYLPMWHICARVLGKECVGLMKPLVGCLWKWIGGKSKGPGKRNVGPCDVIVSRNVSAQAHQPQSPWPQTGCGVVSEAWGMGDDAAEHCALVKTPDTLSAMPLVEQANRGHSALLDDHVWPFQVPIKAWPLL